jgi:hypothetical protein
MCVAAVGHLSPSLPVRERAVWTMSVKAFIRGTAATNRSFSAVFVGTVVRWVASAIWLSSVLRQDTIWAALAWRSLSPVCGIVQVSPPSGATTDSPAFGTGIGTTSYFRPATSSSAGNCHGPFTIIAALPAANWSFTSAWPQFSTDFDADPEFTRSTQSCSACAVCGVAMSVSSPPLVHMNGRNCQAPS